MALNFVAGSGDFSINGDTFPQSFAAEIYPPNKILLRRIEGSGGSLGPYLLADIEVDGATPASINAAIDALNNVVRSSGGTSTGGRLLTETLATLGAGSQIAVTGSSARYVLPAAARGYRVKPTDEARIAVGDNTVVVSTTTGTVVNASEVIEFRVDAGQTHIAVMGSGTINLTVLD